MTQWLANWKLSGWKTSAKKPVKNADLWQRLDAAQDSHAVEWRWVKGHAGNPDNERADALARAGPGHRRERGGVRGSRGELCVVFNVDNPFIRPNNAQPSLLASRLWGNSNGTSR